MITTPSKRSTTKCLLAELFDYIPGWESVGISTSTLNNNLRLKGRKRADSTLKRHLGFLKDQGVITSSGYGITMVYHLSCKSIQGDYAASLVMYKK